MKDIFTNIMARPKTVSWFESLANEYQKARGDTDRVIIVGYAFRRPDLLALEINRHKDGWLGANGEFARVLSRMIQSM